MGQSHRVVVCGIWLAWGGVTLGQSAFTVVARSGQSAPGTWVGYDRFSQASINSAGEVAFYASLAGAGTDLSNNSALYAGKPGSLKLLARAGDPAVGAGPGVPFLTVFDSAPPRLNAQGHVLFGATYWGSNPLRDTPAWGYWLASGPGSVSPVALLEEPGTGDFHPYFPLARPAFTSGDQAAWRDNDGIRYWSAAAGPGPSSGGLELPVINPSGHLALLAWTDEGMAVVSGGSTSPAAITGMPAPTTDAGTRFTLPLYPSINAAGQVAFLSYINTDPPLPGPDYDRTTSLWVATPAADGTSWSQGLIARGGDIAPGTGGRRFMPLNLDIDSYYPPALSPAGEVAFTASFGEAGAMESGLFAGAPGNVRLVARQGQHAPNAPTGIDVAGLSDFDDFAINARGQVALLDRDAGEDGSVLYAADANGGLEFLAATGQPFTLAPGDERTVMAIYLGEVGIKTGGEDGRPSPLNDAGELAFMLIFSDHSSAVVMTTVPEPTGVGISTATGAILWASRRGGRKRLRSRPGIG
jgi:hypothetical protein